MSPDSIAHACARGGRREVVATDRVSGLESVDVVQPRDVEQYAACHDRPEVLDTELRRAAFVDGVVGDAVVQQTVVADVRERVPVRGGLRSHLERVVARREVARGRR